MRLIDADELLNELDRLDLDYGAMGGVAECMDIIEHAPIIEPSGDLISRQLIIGAIKKCGEEKIYPQALIETIKALPSADRPSGEWLYEESGWYGGDGYRCSVCEYGYSATAYHEPYEWHYCPNCGARMAERREE